MPEKTPDLPAMLARVQSRLDEVDLNQQFFGTNATPSVENSQRDVVPLKNVLDAVLTLHQPRQIDLYDQDDGEKNGSVVICSECQRFAVSLNPQAEELVLDGVKYPCATIRAATEKVRIYP